MTIIIQAGGKGQRLEYLTRNKPKALVPIDGQPLLFHIFGEFKDARFIIIADYKRDVLEKYLALFAKDINYTLIKTDDTGTLSGLNEALGLINEPFMLIWCDLILGKESICKIKDVFAGFHSTASNKNGDFDSTAFENSAAKGALSGKFDSTAGTLTQESNNISTPPPQYFTKRAS